jgi:hypothetical protein
VAAEVVTEAFAAGTVHRNSADIPVDITTEKRRSYDRERKRKLRGIPPTSTGNPPTSADNEKTLLLTKKESKLKESKKERATRCPPDWAPSESDLSFALSKGLPREKIPIEAEKFRNYWSAKSGAAATKLDWAATWRNWVLSACERAGFAPPPAIADTTGPPQPPQPWMKSHAELSEFYGKMMKAQNGGSGEGTGILAAGDCVDENKTEGHGVSNGSVRHKGMVSLGSVLPKIPGI